MIKSLFVVVLVSISLNTDLPELNQKVVEYVDSVMGTKVDRGECWDLAAGALKYSGAYFDRSSLKTISIYGRLLNPKKEEVLPGDLIQFENVELNWKDGNMTYKATMAQHTAIVYKVNEAMNYEIAHQNTGEWGKIVGVSNFRLDQVTKGKVMIYRPIKEKG
ncbi:hypothetical protein N6H18_08485 [Reichenbachiella agarivorans]|uniref:BBC1/AIM3 cysteine proteinase-fold domain-containing protein n=1 Tax=Reichenbachiella agarivorans TaxID=2979464 RepID=A0ABY6CTY3_9BACT|nr:hypothetical protein [Reichenbachiella agarivorans]UXP33981.1 hypothetical protein N6H18_08485 [Reichenbachiella agarivorans]